MKLLKFIFALTGVVLIGLWFLKTIAHLEGGSMQSLTTSVAKYQYLAILGFICFWVPPAINWFQSGSKFDFSETLSTLKENLYPSYERKMPWWAHCLRVIALSAIAYFTLGAVGVSNDELTFNWENYFPAVLGAVIFFALPFIFPKKAQ